MKNRNLFIVFVITAILTCIMSLNIFKVSADDETTSVQTPKEEMLIFNVGHGNSCLVRVEGKNILIDGGKQGSFEYIDKFLKDRKVEEFDLLLITHPHADHIGGINSILDKYKVKRFIMKEGKKCKTEMYSKLISKLAEKEIKIEEPIIDGVIDFGKAKLKFSGMDVEASNVNDNSIVIRLEYGTKSVLFTGDISQKAEEGLVEKYGESLKSNVLIVPHHGSSYSSSPEFLKAVSPEIAVVSSSKSPASKTKESYKDIGTEMHGTYRERTIVCNFSEEKASMKHCDTPYTGNSKKQDLRNALASSTLGSANTKEYSNIIRKLDFESEEISGKSEDSPCPDVTISSNAQIEKTPNKSEEISVNTPTSSSMQTEVPCYKKKVSASNILRPESTYKREASDIIYKSEYGIPAKKRLPAS